MKAQLFVCEDLIARHMLFACMQAVLQPDNPSQKYIQQMFRRQQPQVAVEKNPPQPPGMYMFANVLVVAMFAL